jgi:exodeoxyribonuclease VII large subunit
LQSLEIVYQRLKSQAEKFTRHYIFKNPDLLWQSKAQIFDQNYENLLKNFENRFTFISKQTTAAAGKLKALSPRGILKRGYSIVRYGDKIINTSENIKKGDKLNIELYKGKLNCEVLENG